MNRITRKSLKTGFRPLTTAVMIMAILIGLWGTQPAAAATTLTVTPITWNVIGLDSNNPAVGPNLFPVGARVCNTGSLAASNMTATFVWDSSNTYINLQPGTSSTLSIASLAAGACTDFYFNAEVTRTSAAYNTTRSYHIAVSADGGATTGSTPTPRELFVEHLISQSRNTTSGILLNGVLVPPGGSMNLVVGETYTITLNASTATNGYNQLEAFLTLPNNIFQINSVTTTYSVDSSGYVSNSNNKLYADACLWDSNPNSPTYRSCIGSDGKAGGTVTTTYNVTIIGGAGSLNTINTLIYDFSGSSFHYNGDFSAYALVGSVASPLNMTKSFSPTPITSGSTSTLSITITNITTNAFTGVNLVDPLPSSPAQLSVATTPNASITGTGCSGTFAPTGGATSLSLTNLSIPASGTCTLHVNVTASTTGTYVNTTGHLFIGNADTGVTASANLTVASSSPGTGFCPNNVTMAQWTVPSTSTNPPDLTGGLPTTKNASVFTATVVANLPADTGIVSTSGFNDTFSWNTWGYKTSGQFILFTIDTSNFSNVVFSFYEFNPGSGNGPNNLQLLYSTNGGATFTLATTFAAKNSAFTQYTYNFTGLTNTSGNTLFKLFSNDANADNSNGNLRYDLMTFTGNQVGNCPSAQKPTLTKSFTPATITLNGTSQLQFVLSNPNTTQLTGLSFSDTLPAGVTVATSGPTTVCTSGSLTTTAPSTIVLTGGTLPASGSCTININVTGVSAGIFNNVSGVISSTESGANTGTTGFGTATLTVIAPPAIVKAFSPNPIYAGSTSTLTFTITNPNATIGLTGVAFTDTFPTSPGAMVVASPTGASTSGCGSPTFSPGASSGSISFSGGTILAGGTCVVTVNVAASVTGSYANTSGAVTSTNGGTGNTAAATLVVQTTHPSINILKQVSTSLTGPWTSTVNVIVGTSIYYRIIIENTGDVPLSPVSVTDPSLDPISCTWPAVLQVGTATVDPTASCVLGPITAQTGGGSNTATAHGSFGATNVDSLPSTATYNITSLSLGKSLFNRTSFSAVGDVIQYVYTITNNGTATLNLPATVTDSNATVNCDATDSDGDTLLEQNESLNCFASYTVTAYDLSVGSISNTAYATVGGVTSNMTEATIHENKADLIVSKTNDTNGYATVGVLFNWKILVTNQGTVDATFSAGQTILSDQLPSAATYGSPTLGSIFNIINSGNISCSIDGSNLLTCVASGGSVTIQGSNGRFAVSFAVTPSTYGSLTNTATVDPNNNILESNEGNNTGSDSLNVAESPTAVKVKSFTAERAKNSIVLTWVTAQEVDNLGFNLYRATSENGPRVKINAVLIPARPGSQHGAVYSYTDTNLKPNHTYYYWLEDVDIHGTGSLTGPISVKTLAGKTK